MKSKSLLFTAALFVLGSIANAQTPEFVLNKVNYLEVSNGNLLMEAGDYKSGTQGLWISDGTTTGSKLLKALTTTGNPYYTENSGLTYFFSRDDNSSSILWKTDGTASGTSIVKNLIGRQASTTPMVSFNNHLYFRGVDATHGKELWRSDGTEAGTKLFKDTWPGLDNGINDGYMIVFDNKLFFRASDGPNNVELWVSDGTEANTELFKDIDPSGSGYPSSFSVVNGKLYFSGTTESEGNELWVSDGSVAGTHLIKDIAAPGEYGPSAAIEYKGKAFFTIAGKNQPRQLWSTDGTDGGTTLIEENVGRVITVFNGNLYFSKVSGSYYALYKSDGTSGTGDLVKVLEGGSSKTAPYGFVKASDKLYFFCTFDEGGANFVAADIWETDGTTNNTKLIESSPGNLAVAYNKIPLTEYNGALFFVDLSNKLYKIGNPTASVSDDDLNGHHLTLFPNPARRQLTIKANEKLIGVNYTVLNIMGQVITSGTINDRLTVLDVEAFPAGSYFLRTQSKDGGQVSSFIKK